MYLEDIISVSFAGKPGDGFLISYDKDMAKDADGDDSDDQKEAMNPGYGRVTRFAADADAAGKMVATLLAKAQPVDKSKAFNDAFEEGSNG